MYSFIHSYIYIFTFSHIISFSFIKNKREENKRMIYILNARNMFKDNIIKKSLIGEKIYNNIDNE